MADQEMQPSCHSAGAPSMLAFADEVAHDLRNILNNLHLNLQYLEMTLDLEQPSTSRAMQRMRDEVARLRQLVEDLPRRARAEAGDRPVAR
jgi:signal transduction histidine kinase